MLRLYLRADKAKLASSQRPAPLKSNGQVGFACRNRYLSKARLMVAGHTLVRHLNSRS